MRWTLAVLLLCCALAIPANAQHRRGGDGWQGGGHSRGGGYSHQRHGSGYGLPLGGILGGILGGWIAGTMSRPTLEQPPPMEEAPLVPWSPPWLAYCTDRYKSFNPETGRYFGYDGEYHFCQG